VLELLLLFLIPDSDALTYHSFIMGSISSFLVHNASVPVSVVRNHKLASQRKRRPSAARKLSQSVQSGELKVDEAE
jgi:hypothetical protein